MLDRKSIKFIESQQLSIFIVFNSKYIIFVYLTGNCLRLEGSGYLNHYSCVERFNNGCSLAPYFDDEIFKCGLRLFLKKYKDL